MRQRVIGLTLSLACSLICLLTIPLAAQNPQDTSVADAARQAREQKKPAGKPAKVITNDNLPAAPKPEATAASLEATSQLSPAADASAQPAPSADAAATSTGTSGANAPASRPAAASAAGDAQKKAQVEDLKQQVAEQQKQVDLLLRLYALDQDAYLSNPNHGKDLQGKAKLDAQQEEIHDKVAELARTKAKLDAIAPGESAKVTAPPKS
jgi:hypothetical protein